MYEAEEVGHVILVATQDTAKVLKQSEQSLDFPAPLVAAQSSTVLGRRLVSITAMRGNQLDALLFEIGVQFVAFVGLIPDQSFRGIGDKPVLESLGDKGG